ncbi:leucyl/phenylalanyl-tRNA--protein transferase [Catenovulum sp. 2E275]|uniref:leucyl/phenylalanyl-tRNA--protein transferase n=1 Tax=Catenovulum sp. 2E275 TaxID=2980497 RepID=UPI0021D3A003|nr:leucyl/phenylalanyl-tRNA--protein transferase [Catenovulum sp. 2E275]MCU4674677.1 leucyl/phenylalanyl-tRNA--protein transferase [Catenovulum sp. 2E275]
MFYRLKLLRCHIALFQLDDDNITFPPAQLALKNPNGLLAIGGDLSPERLLSAYHNGIFPWFSPGEPILWWSPDPRGVLFLNDLHISKSLKKSIRKSDFRFTINQAFSQVIQHCAHIRAETDGTWITDEMIYAYTQLNQKNHAYSIEVWQNEQLVGGLYGILVGGLFCGESMFHKVTDASKAAFCCLVDLCKRSGVELIDCQMQNSHLQTLGVSEISRNRFLDKLNTLKTKQINRSLWEACTNESLNPY